VIKSARILAPRPPRSAPWPRARAAQLAHRREAPRAPPGSGAAGLKGVGGEPLAPPERRGARGTPGWPPGRRAPPALAQARPGNGRGPPGRALPGANRGAARGRAPRGRARRGTGQPGRAPPPPGDGDSRDGSGPGSTAAGEHARPGARMMNHGASATTCVFSGAAWPDPPFSDVKPPKRHEAGTVDTSGAAKEKLCVVLPGIGQRPGQGHPAFCGRQGLKPNVGFLRRVLERRSGAGDEPPPETAPWQQRA